MILDLFATLLLATPPAAARGVATGTAQAQDDRSRSAGEDDSDAEARPFRIPDHGAAKSRMARADEHLAAGRYAEAITELQGLLEEHRGDLLGGEHPPAIGRALSKQPVFPGAARRARERLIRLPPQARELYRQRFERDASAALDRARARGDRGALAEIARRWPLTRAAEQAWWALGDLEHERGEEDKALAAWGRALASRLGDSSPDPTNALTSGLATADAWKRIEAGLAAAGGTTDGVQQRMAVARAEASAAASSTASPGFASALEPGAPGPLPPLSDLGQESWADGVDLPPHPISGANQLEELFPARAADVVLVSTTLRLFALHAWSGALLWDSGEPAGWDALGERDRKEFFEGIDRSEALIAPASGGRVALAALQIPVSFVGSFRYSANVPVTTIIPDRRLFAFDLETGARIWSHEPPRGWDGEGGSFAQRMSVAGPPVVVGGRVLAPFYRLQGRIDYHVGCFDLETGALIWSTALISGQRELNMFGRAQHEFSAPPVVVVGDKVVALTQLGTVAELDLFTGELLWETLYDQIPLPKNLGIGTGATSRQVAWHNGPPAIAEGVVVAAPFDSQELFGLDLGSGAMLWSVPRGTIQERAGGYAGGTVINQLVGARRSTVFVFGKTLAALRAPRGLAQSAPEATGGWNFADDRFLQGSQTGRPVLAGDRIFVPFADDLLEIDVETGRRVASRPWSNPGAGINLVVGPGEVTAISHQRVSATFDWEVLTQRARADVAAHPADPGLVLTLGRLLADRGTSEWQRGQAGAARAHIDEAEAVLSRVIAARAPESAAARDTSAPRAEGEASLAGAELHRVLRAKARLRSGLADRAGALAALKKARALAPDAGALRDTLLEELALLRSSEPAGAPHGSAYLDAEQELERSCGELPILCDVLPADEGQDARAAALGAGPSGLPRFTPLVGGSARRDAAPWEVPAGLWVLLDRTATAEDDGDARAQFESLHAILERHGTVELPGGTAASLAADRIGTLLREGRMEGYEAFEVRARALFDEASSAHDAAGLEKVARLYPHSKAADDADDRRLAWAMEGGDAASVAQIVQAMLPRGPSVSAVPGAVPTGASVSGWRLSSATEREVRALLRLSSVLARGGSRELSSALLRRLGQVRPEVRSDLDGDGGRTLAELAAGITRWKATDPDADIGTFRELKKEVRIQLNGEWEILGRLPPDERPSREGAAPHDGTSAEAREAPNLGSNPCAVLGVVPYRNNQAVVNTVIQTDGSTGFPSSVVLPIPPRSFGSTTPPLARCGAVVPGRILVATEAGVSAVDERGDMAWEWRAKGIPPASVTVACAAGIAVVSIDHGAGKRSLQALDARSGLELWDVPITDPGLSLEPTLSAERVVLLPSGGRRRTLVLDLFTGRETVTFLLDTAAAASTSEDAWIQDDLLIIPWFLESRTPSRNQVVAYDLSSGSRAWRVAIGEDRPGPNTTGSSTGGSPDGTAPGGDRSAPETGGGLDAPRDREPDSRELAGVLQCAERTWLLVRPAGGTNDRTASPSILELSPRIGALSPLPGVRISPNDRLVGLAVPRRFSIPKNVILLLGNREGSAEARLRAVDLDQGELWAQALQVSIGFLDQGRMQPPLTAIPPAAFSGDSIAIAYSVLAGQGVGVSTHVETFDAKDGRTLGATALRLARDMGRSDEIRFHPLGDGLLVRGRSGLEVLR